MAFGIDDSGKFINIFGVKDGQDAPLFTFKGTKATVSELPASGSVGDVWVVEADGHKYAWDGSNWKDIGAETPDLSNYVQKTDKATASNLGLVKPDGTTITIDNNGVISSQGGQGGIVIDIGSASETYKTYAIPKIEKADAQTIYEAYVAGQNVVLLWQLLDEDYISVIGAGEVLGEYSFEVVVHNKFHISYKWDSETETYCTFEVNDTEAVIDVETTGESGTLVDDEIALINNDANIINDGQKYYLSNKLSTLTYRTYINTDVGTNTDLTAKAIYVQLNEEAVNYGTWSKEDLEISATILDNSISRAKLKDECYNLWTISELSIWSNTTISASGSIDLSSYLPDDGQDYEVKFIAWGRFGNLWFYVNSKPQFYLYNSGTDYTSTAWSTSGVKHSMATYQGTMILDSTRAITYTHYANLTEAYFRVLGYRKVEK